MGVEFKQYLIPRPNSLRPTPEQLAHFVAALASDGWVPTTSGASFYTEGSQDFVTGSMDAEWFRACAEKEVILSWHVGNLAQSGLTYPFDRLELPREGAYYEFQLHLSHDYVYHVSELIDPFDEVRCRCGEYLEYDGESEASLFYAGRIRHVCPNCSKPFDVSTIPAVVRDGWTSDERVVNGGAAYRFALVIDCGKAIPTEEGNPKIHPALKALCEREFQCPFYEVSDMY